MSFNTHARDAVDLSAPINHRCSHLRSCALKLAQLQNVARSAVIDMISESTGINILRNDLSNDQIISALEFIKSIRNSELGAAIQIQNQAQQGSGGQQATRSEST
ncbi:MAG: hypothetical protein ACSHX0_13510 [Akkermansiaceae bacterium]